MSSSSSSRKGTYYIALAALWPKLYKLECCFCGGKASSSGVDTDGEYAHLKCMRAEVRS